MSLGAVNAVFVVFDLLLVVGGGSRRVGSRLPRMELCIFSDCDVAPLLMAPPSPR